MGTCVLSIFIRLGEQGDGGLSLWGLKSFFPGDLLLSGMMVIPSGSSMAMAQTCLDALLLGGPEAGYMALPLPSIQPEEDGPGDTRGLVGQWQGPYLSFLMACPRISLGRPFSQPALVECLPSASYCWYHLGLGFLFFF